jgi:hypothetical protein
MRKIRSCIYIFDEIWKEFVKICKREGANASNKLEAFMQAYNQQHRAGNPQLLISNYIKMQERSPIRVLCLYCQGALTDGRVFCQRKGGMWISSIQCYSCKYNQLRKLGEGEKPK